MQKNHSKSVITIVLALLVLTTMVMYFGVTKKSKQEIKIDGIFLKNPLKISDFQLTNQDGDFFTKANLKGHWSLMFFGFTNCGMVCPTTLAELNSMYRTLLKDLPSEQLPQVIMVSVDPQRDTTARMKSYVTAFNPHFMGLRGEVAEINALEKQLHIVSLKMQVEGQSKEHYTINHSAEIMLFNPEGKLQAFLSYPHQAEQMAKDYKLILRSQIS